MVRPRGGEMNVKVIEVYFIDDAVKPLDEADRVAAEKKLFDAGVEEFIISP